MKNKFIKNYKAVIGGIILLSIFIISCFFVSNVSALSVYPKEVGNNYIIWNYSSDVNFISLNGENIIFDNSSNELISTNLQSNTPYKIIVKNNLSSEENITYTLPIEKDSLSKIADVIYNIIWIILIIALMAAGIRIPLVSAIAFIFALVQLLYQITLGNFLMDIVYLSLLIGASFITYIGVKK